MDSGCEEQCSGWTDVLRRDLPGTVGLTLEAEAEADNKNPKEEEKGLCLEAQGVAMGGGKISGKPQAPARERDEASTVWSSCRVSLPRYPIQAMGLSTTCLGAVKTLSSVGHLHRTA